jgi:hypothetical protein
MNGLEPIGLPTWRQDAIARVIGVYDSEDVNNEPLIRVKRNATDVERYNELLELLSEVFPEAAGLVRSSKAAPKTKLSIIMARLNEVSLDGREFAAISSTAYDWRDRQDDLEEKLQQSVKRARKPANSKAKGPASDEAIKAVVKATEPKPATRKPPTRRKS